MKKTLLILWLTGACALAEETLTSTIQFGNFIANTNKVDSVDDNGSTIAADARYRNLNLNGGTFMRIQVQNPDSISHAYSVTLSVDGPQAKGTKFQNPGTIGIGTVAAGQTVAIQPSTSYNTRVHVRNGSGDAGTWGSGDSTAGTAIRLKVSLYEDSVLKSWRFVQWDLSGSVFYGSSATPSNTYGAGINVEFVAGEIPGNPGEGYHTLTVDHEWLESIEFGNVLIKYETPELGTVELDTVAVTLGGNTHADSYSVPAGALVYLEPEPLDQIILEGGSEGSILMPGSDYTWEGTFRLYPADMEYDVRLNVVNKSGLPGAELLAKDALGTIETLTLDGENGTWDRTWTMQQLLDLEAPEGYELEVIGGDLNLETGKINRIDMVLKEVETSDWSVTDSADYQVWGTNEEGTGGWYPGRSYTLTNSETGEKTYVATNSKGFDPVEGGGGEEGERESMSSVTYNGYGDASDMMKKQEAEMARAAEEAPGVDDLGGMKDGPGEDAFETFNNALEGFQDAVNETDDWYADKWGMPEFPLTFDGLATASVWYIDGPTLMASNVDLQIEVPLDIMPVRVFRALCKFVLLGYFFLGVYKFAKV